MTYLPSSSVVSKRSPPYLRVHDAKTGEDLTGRLCFQCQSFNPDNWISSEEIPPNQKSWMEGWKKCRFNAQSGCPLCRFFVLPKYYPFEIGDMEPSSREYLLLCSEKGGPGTFNPYLFLGRITPYNREYLPVDSSGHMCYSPKDIYRPLLPDCVDFAPIRQWITHCATSHPECNSMIFNDDKRLPLNFRLIDCDSGQVIFANHTVPYVALSYVWGAPSTHIHTPGITGYSAKNMYPRTIRDAMAVVKDLGFRYLWVDKYCIEQANASDLMDQVFQMHLIYSRAALTIIDAVGENAEHGLSGVQSGSRSQKVVVLNGTKFVSVSGDIHGMLQRSKWNTRAWTYQEGFFSRRRLIFTHEEVGFECHEASYTESRLPVNPNSPPQTTTWSRVYPMVETVWKSCHILERLQEYTPRQLSYQSDAINAIRGLLSFDTGLRMRKSYRPVSFRHIHGIPTDIRAYIPELWNDVNIDWFMTKTSQRSEKENLYMAVTCGLAWYTEKHRDPKGSSTIRRPGFPSWSWAGWTGAVGWRPDAVVEFFKADEIPTWIGLQRVDGTCVELSNHLIDAIDQQVRNNDEIYTNRLVMDVTIVKIRLSYSPSDKNWVVAAKRKIDDGFLWSVWRATITASIEEGKDIHKVLDNDTFECIILTFRHGLILRNLGGIAERIGSLYLSDGRYFSTSDAHEGLDYFSYAGKQEMSNNESDFSNCSLKLFFPTEQKRIVVG